MPREIYKPVEIGGARYVIRKFDAMTGLQLARLLLAKAAPLFPLLSDGEKEDSGLRGKALYDAVALVMNSLTDDEIASLMKKCLRVCYADLPAGKQAVMDEYGNYGVEDIEYDFGLVLRLCAEAIAWGASDFFGGGGWDSR